MQDSKDNSGFHVSQLTAINAAKILTILILLGLALVYGVHDTRQVIYLCLHISYCVWWLLEQWLFPLRGKQIFTDKAGGIEIAASLLFVGVFYSLPGYFAFVNPQPISYITIAIALPLYIFGSLINLGADIQKMVAKDMGAGLVDDGIWRSVRHINYMGDLMRYSSYSVVAGSAWAYLLPATIALLYIQRIKEKEQAMSAKYSEFGTYQQNSSCLIPGIW